MIIKGWSKQADIILSVVYYLQGVLCYILDLTLPHRYRGLVTKEHNIGNQRVHLSLLTRNVHWCIHLYTCAISAFHHESCGFEFRSWRSVPDTTLCDKVCHWLVLCQLFSHGTPVSSTDKTDRHDITEILLKVKLNTITIILLYTLN